MSRKRTTPPAAGPPRLIVTPPEETGANEKVGESQQRCDDSGHVGECCSVESSVDSVAFVFIDDARFDNESFRSSCGVEFNRQRDQLKQ